MKKIDYPKVLLMPCNLDKEVNQRILYSLTENIFPLSIKKALQELIDEYYMAYKPEYPTEPKEFYIIPFGKMDEIFEEYNLQPPKFASLWLPSIATKVEEIRGKLADDSKEIVIIRYDYYFSKLAGNHRMVVDISLGFPTFVLWEDNIGRFHFDPNCWMLAEPK
jgi:hypothetical protein